MKAIILTLVSVSAISILLVCGIVFTARDRLKVESSGIDIKTLQIINSLDCINDMTRVFDKYSVQIFDKNELDNSSSIEISFETPGKDNKNLVKFEEETNLILENGCQID